MAYVKSTSKESPIPRLYYPGYIIIRIEQETKKKAESIMTLKKLKIPDGGASTFSSSVMTTMSVVRLFHYLSVLFFSNRLQQTSSLGDVRCGWYSIFAIFGGDTVVK